MRTLIPLALLIWTLPGVALCQGSEGYFDVSLWSSRTDLSAEYQQMIQEATEAYRGDFAEIVAAVQWIRRFEAPPKLDLVSDPFRPEPPKLDLVSDPFPSEPFTLSLSRDTHTELAVGWCFTRLRGGGG